jgi:tetratricopeptide (TPR) repeat protein
MPGLHELTFRHHLLHQFTYRSLLKRDRRRNHELAAAWLEATVADRRGEYLGTIGEHYERAGSANQAMDCYALAAEHAAERGAREVVLDLVERALALVTEDDIQSRWRLVATREQVLALGDDRARHDDDLDALEALAESLGDDVHRTEACLRRARALVDQGEYQRATSVGQRAVEYAERSGDSERLVDGCRLVATAAWRMGDLDAALRLGRRSLAAAEALGPSRAKAASLRILATIEAEAGDILRGETLSGLSLEISRAVGDRTGEASVLTSIGCMARTWGALDDARLSFEGTLRLARETGWTYGESLALVNLAELHALVGDYAAALATGRAAADIAVLSGARDLEAAALLTAGYAEVGLGDLASARATFSRSRELFQTNDSSHYALAPTAGLAVVNHLEGDDTSALALIEEVIRHLDEGGTLAGVDLRMETFLRCYEVLHACGDDRAGRVLATAVMILSEEAGRFDDERRQQYLHGAPEHHAVMAAWAASIPG